MPPLIISGAISFVANLLIGLFVYFKNPRNRLNVFFALFSLMVSGWSVGSFLENVIPDRRLALTVLRFNYLFAVWLPAFYIHFVYSFATITPVRRQILRIAYSISVALMTVLFTPLFIRDLRVLQSQPYQFLISSPGPIYYVFFAYFGVSTCEVLRTTLREAKLNSGHRRLQFRYLTIANAIAIAAGFEYFFRVFGLLKSPPWDDYILVVYLLVLAYAMVRHHLMDIRLAIARGVIFVLSHALAIGVPLVMAFSGEAWLRSLAGDKWWMIPFGLLAGLSALVPALYGFLQAHAEARIFKTERRYQAAIRTMSQELIGFTEEEDLSQFIGQFVQKQMQLSSAQLLVQSDGLGLLPKGGVPEELQELLRHYFIAPGRMTAPLLVEESGASSEPPGTDERIIRDWMRSVGLSVLVPGVLRGQLVSCLTLGPKHTKEMFTQDDYEVLGALTRQSALVLTNLQLYEEVAEQKRRLLEDAMERKRLAQLGELALGVSHEFNNLLSDLLQPLGEMTKHLHNPTALPALMEEMQTLISLRGRCITTASSAYKNKCASALQTHSLALVITDAFSQAQKTKFAGSEADISLTRSIDPLLSLEGNATLPQLFLNLFYCLGWACEFKHEAGALSIEASQEGQDSVVIRLIMRGGADPSSLPAAHGLAEELGKHGGLYLVVARMIVNDHQGQLTMDTTQGGGTTFTLRLPQQQPADSPLRRPLPQPSIF